jgi:SsrA-binding protein
MPVLLINKKARFEYNVLESYQAGLSLSGKMVKIIREKKVTLQGVYIVYQKNQLQIIGLGTELHKENISLLLNQKEKIEIVGAISQKGISCVPLSIKTVGRWLKTEIAIVKGKKEFEKRETLKKRDLDREMARENI